VLGVLEIDLAKQVTERLTGVARGSNAQEKHTPETKVATRRAVDPHWGHTTGFFCRWMETEMLFIGMLSWKAERGSKIDQNRVSLSRYPRLSPLPFTFLRKIRGEVSDDFNPECESRQSRSRHGPSGNQLPALDRRIPAAQRNGVSFDAANRRVFVFFAIDGFKVVSHRA
jgi:hypothetical protein